MMLEILEHGFMRYALIAGVTTGLTAAVLGNFVVAARQSVLSDMLAHAALVGVGLGIFWHVSPTVLAVVATVLSAMILQRLNRQPAKAPEAYSMLILTGSLAVALLLSHVNKDNPIALESYLFGSILTITPAELMWFTVLNIAILATIFLLWRPFLALVFDPEYLRVRARKSRYEMLFLLLLGGLVGLGLKVIGGLLIGALLVIPVLTVRPFCTRFSQSVWMSMGVNIIAVISGIISSFYLDIPTSSAIVLSLLIGFSLARGLFRR